MPNNRELKKLLGNDRFPVNQFVDERWGVWRSTTLIASGELRTCQFFRRHWLNWMVSQRCDDLWEKQHLRWHSWRFLNRLRDSHSRKGERTNHEMRDCFAKLMVMILGSRSNFQDNNRRKNIPPRHKILVD